jgi:anaerobic dimethyl sulfoxide reductase subunit B (iron-sulfur subunit)
MSVNAILVDYEWCSGCKTCVVACQMEHGLPVDRCGVIVTEIGPWEIETDRWQHSFVPSFTDECDLCSQRQSMGKQPSCVQHCQAQVLTFGTLDELTPKLTAKRHQSLIVP